MLVSFVVACLLVAPEPPKKDEKKPELSAAAKKELKKLEGKWQVVKVVGKDTAGEPNDPEMVFEFTGNKMAFVFGPQKGTAEVTAIDTGTDPMCIDLTSERPGGRGPLTAEGIFAFDGDTLRLALTGNGEKLRPTTFDKPTDARVVVWTFKRVKK